MAYDPTNLNTTTEAGRVNAVRLWVGDTDSTEEQLTDDEIIYYLGLTDNKIINCAVLVAYSLGAKYARLVDTELEGVLKEDYSKLSENYYRLSSQLKMQSAQGNLSIGLPTGVNTATPEFYVGQFENIVDQTRGYNEV